MGICLHACFFAFLVTFLFILVCTCYVPHTSELYCAAIPASLSLSNLMEFKIRWNLQSSLDQTMVKP